MMASRQKGPFCQSCGMPLATPDDFGTAATGMRINSYCRHCYDAGAFTEPNITATQMIDRSVGMMARQGIMPEPEARAQMTDVIPRLQRWRKPAAL